MIDVHTYVCMYVRTYVRTYIHVSSLIEWEYLVCQEEYKCRNLFDFVLHVSYGDIICYLVFPIGCGNYQPEIHLTKAKTALMFQNTFLDLHSLKD